MLWEESETSETRLYFQRAEHRNRKLRIVSRSVRLYEDDVLILTVEYGGALPGTPMKRLEEVARWAYMVRRSLFDEVYHTPEYVLTMNVERS